jgi:hypothetical protein
MSKTPLDRNEISAISCRLFGRYLSSEELDFAEQTVFDSEDLFLFFVLHVKDNEKIRNLLQIDHYISECKVDNREVWPDNLNVVLPLLRDQVQLFRQSEFPNASEDLALILTHAKLSRFIRATNI